MGYRLCKGVVLFQMCGKSFLFPSREADGLVAAIISVPDQLATILRGENDAFEVDGTIQSDEIQRKLKRLSAAGFIEEY